MNGKMIDRENGWYMYMNGPCVFDVFPKFRMIL